MVGGVPVLGVDDVLEALAETVDERNDLIAAFNGEGTAGTEIILDVDDEESISDSEIDGHVANDYGTNK